MILIRAHVLWKMSIIVNRPAEVILLFQDITFSGRCETIIAFFKELLSVVGSHVVTRENTDFFKTLLTDIADVDVTTLQMRCDLNKLFLTYLKIK